jgi:membrane-associated phospholipid phosphatase
MQAGRIFAKETSKGSLSGVKIATNASNEQGTMESVDTLSANCAEYGRAGPRDAALNLGRVVLVALVLVGNAVAQHTDPTSPSPAPAAQQVPDAPSTSKQKQSDSLGHAMGTIVKTIADDEWTMIKAPLQTDGLGFDTGTPFRNKTLYWNAAVLTGTGILIANDESVAAQVNPAWHTTSTNIASACTYGTAAVAGGIFVTGLFRQDEHAKRTGILSAEAAIDVALFYGGMKLIFNRDRPYMDNGEGKFFTGNFSSGSFPSGHAAMAWTLASVVAHEYPKWPVELAMYGAATAVATTRVTGGQHFPSDVFFGSAMGYLVGRYVANKDKRLTQHDPAHAGNKLSRIPSTVLQHVSFQ